MLEGIVLNRQEKKFFEAATVGGKDIAEAYLHVYGPKKNNKSLTNCLFNKKKRRPEIFQAIEKYKQELFELAKKTQKEAVVKAAEENALEKSQKREVLSKIIEGELLEELIVVIDGVPTKVYRKPSVKDRIAAIRTDNDMAGHNASTPGDNTTNNFLVMMKNIFTLNNSNIPNVLTESNGNNTGETQV